MLSSQQDYKLPKGRDQDQCSLLGHLASLEYAHKT